MALIDCPGCGNKVSDRASSCPKCGMNLILRKKQTERLNELKLEKSQVEDLQKKDIIEPKQFDQIIQKESEKLYQKEIKESVSKKKKGNRFWLVIGLIIGFVLGVLFWFILALVIPDDMVSDVGNGNLYQVTENESNQTKNAILSIENNIGDATEAC